MKSYGTFCRSRQRRCRSHHGAGRDAIRKAEAAGETTVRLHTGDSSIFGAVREQFDELDKLGIAYDVCPGVSAFCGAAASLKTEYTLPDVSQTVIITRAPREHARGGRIQGDVARGEDLPLHRRDAA